MKVKHSNVTAPRNVLTDGFGEWVQVEGTAEIVRLPEAMDGLVEYYRRLSGEHPDWDDYRAAMVRDRRVLVRITVTRSGPNRLRARFPADEGSGSRSTATAQAHDVEPRTLLVQYLREACGLTGTKVGCDTSSCGACTVLVDGESVKSCTMLAAQADGRAVTTIEGLADGRRVAPGADRRSTSTTACSAGSARRAW